MPDDSLRSHARWSLRAVLLDIMPWQLAHAGAFLCCPHASPFGTGPKGAKAPPAFFAYGSQRKPGKEISGSPSAQHGHNAAVLRPGRALPAPIGAESGSLRAAGTNPMTSCPSKRDPGSSRLSFRAPWKGSKGSVHSSLPPSVPRRGDLLLSCQRDKRSKTRVRFLCLEDTKKPEPKKSHSPRFLGR